MVGRQNPDPCHGWRQNPNPGHMVGTSIRISFMDGVRIRNFFIVGARIRISIMVGARIRIPVMVGAKIRICFIIRIPVMVEAGSGSIVLSFPSIYGFKKNPANFLIHFPIKEICIRIYFICVQVQQRFEKYLNNFALFAPCAFSGGRLK